VVGVHVREVYMMWKGHNCDLEDSVIHQELQLSRDGLLGRRGLAPVNAVVMGM